ncbi:MAG: hypothetical protein II953_00235, partial [Clostridia bacterium]|nr:hypothetical protein [Clostridia bacterium]
TTPQLGKEEGGVPQLTESASLAPDGSVVATVVNASPVESAEILTCVADFEISDIKAEILAGEAHDHNSFEDKTAVGTRAFEDFEKQANGFATVLPPCSVVKFVIR